MAGLFKKNGRARRIPEKLAQYDDEYLLYCVEKDRVETVLESTLHETDDPKEIIDVTLKTVCEFYGGDWAGVMDIDMDTCLWRPVCWFRAGGATDRTRELISGLEDAEVMPRWLEAMHSAMPIVLTDTTEIRESNPVEFALYERLEARAVLHPLSLRHRPAFLSSATLRDIWSGRKRCTSSPMFFTARLPSRMSWNVRRSSRP